MGAVQDVTHERRHQHGVRHCNGADDRKHGESDADGRERSNVAEAASQLFDHSRLHLRDVHAPPCHQQERSDHEQIRDRVDDEQELGSGETVDEPARRYACDPRTDE